MGGNDHLSEGGARKQCAGWWERPGTEHLPVTGLCSTRDWPEARVWPDRQDGPCLSGEEAAPGASRKTFLFQQQHGVTAWLHVTACPLHTVPAHLEGFPRDWAPPWSSQPPVPPCSASPGGRGGRSLGQPREAHVEAGQGPGWWCPYSKPGCRGCRLVRPIPWWCGRVEESVAVGADQSRVSVHAECP